MEAFVKPKPIIGLSFQNGIIFSLIIWIVAVSAFALIFLTKSHHSISPGVTNFDGRVISCGPNTPLETSPEPYPWQVDTPPKQLNLNFLRKEIKYPKIAFDNKIEGRVKVKILIDSKGNVSKISNISGPEVFHNEIRINIERLIFKPAMKDGKPVKCWVLVPFNFRLKKEK